MFKFLTPKLIFGALMVLIMVLAVGQLAVAANTNNLEGSLVVTDNFATKGAGYPKADDVTPEMVVGRIINYTLSFLGVVFFVLMVIGGWQWLLAHGNEEAITKAKALIFQAIIGLAIVFAAYLIAAFVVSAIVGSIGLETGSDI